MDKSRHLRPPARRPHDRGDVSNGREEIPIPWRNDHWDPAREQQGQGGGLGEKRAASGGRRASSDIPEEPPSDWIYMERNTAYDKAFINWAVDSMEEGTCADCEGDCGDRWNRAFCCCATFHGEFAYGPGGVLTDRFLERAVSEHELLKGRPREGSSVRPQFCPDKEKCEFSEEEEDCPGHINRTFIKECGVLCSCSSARRNRVVPDACRNRVVQNGITRPLELVYHLGKGWGVHTKEAIPRGAFVLEYQGEVMTNTEQDERNKRRNRKGQMKQHFAVQLDACFATERKASDKEALVLDGTYMGNLGRFINHECVTANLVDVPVEYDCADRNYYHVAFFATRDIKADEELTWEYEKFDQDNFEIPSFACLCGSPHCQMPANAVGGQGPKSKAKKGKGGKKAAL